MCFQRDGDFVVIPSCGKTGIRTPETLLRFTRFPGVPLQPLEHLSIVSIETACKVTTKKLNTQKKSQKKVKKSSFYIFLHKISSVMSRQLSPAPTLSGSAT